MLDLIHKIVGEHNSILYFLNTLSQVVATLFAIIATLTIFKIQFSNSSLTEIQKILYSLVNHKKGKLHKEILGKHINDQLANSDGSNNEFYSICMEKVNKWKQTQDKSIYCDDCYKRFELYTDTYKKELDNLTKIIAEAKCISLFSIILIGTSLFSLTFSKFLENSNYIFALSFAAILILFFYLFRIYNWTINIISLE